MRRPDTEVWVSPHKQQFSSLDQSSFLVHKKYYNRIF